MLLGKMFERKISNEENFIIIIVPVYAQVAQLK